MRRVGGAYPQKQIVHVLNGGRLDREYTTVELILVKTGRRRGKGRLDSLLRMKKACVMRSLELKLRRVNAKVE